MWRRWLACLTLWTAVCLHGQTVAVSGTVLNPDGSNFNGSMTIQLARSTVVNTCVSPAQVVPFTPVNVKVVAGAFPTTNLMPTSCMSPRIPYYVQVFTATKQPLYSDNWYIPQTTSGDVNVGDLGSVQMASGITVSVPLAIISTPPGNQTITQPSGTSLSVNNLIVTGSFNLAGSFGGTFAPSNIVPGTVSGEVLTTVVANSAPLWELPTAIAPAQQQVSYPGQYAGVAQVILNTNNPVIPYGTSGAFDAGETRDMELIRTYGTQAHEYYMLYTAAALTASPYDPTIGIAHSDDGLNWTKDGQVIPATGTCGGVFSPGAYYDWNPDTLSGSQILYVYVSCIASASQWYSGPINIYTLAVASGSSWTSPSSYVWQSGPTLCGNGQGGCTTGQSWEGGQGVYAPDVKDLNGTYTMFYSSSDGATFWNIGAATAFSPLGPWTKYASNPVTRSSIAEEPNVLVQPNGGLLMFSDTIGLAQLGSGVSIYTTSASSGLAEPWTEQQFVSFNYAGPSGQTWYSSHIGSQSVVAMPNGDTLVAFGGNNGGTDQIGTAIIRMQQDVLSAYGQSTALQTSYQDLIYNSAGTYPILVRLTAKGYTQIGDATDNSSGELILGDIGSGADNVGIRRSPDGVTNMPGNWLALDGYDGITFNVGNDVFGSKWNAWSILPTGQTTLQMSGTSTTYGVFNVLKPSLATSGCAGQLFGAASSNYNSSLIEFCNIGGTDSTSNTASLGVTGSAGGIKINGLGQITLNSGTTITSQVDGVFPVTCSLSSSQFSTCTATVSWGATFADTSYSAECTISNASVSSVVVGTSSKTQTQMNVVIANLTSSSGSVSDLDCHAVRN